jgi:hypothetical protein
MAQKYRLLARAAVLMFPTKKRQQYPKLLIPNLCQKVSSSLTSQPALMVAAAHGRPHGLANSLLSTMQLLL